MQHHVEAARALATRWSQAGPNAVAERLRRYELEARASNYTWPHFSADVCAQIAEQTRSAVEWYAALQNAGCSAEVLAPFLGRMALSAAPGWEAIVTGALDDGALRAMAVAFVLTLPNASESLVGQAMDRLDGLAMQVEMLCLRGVVSEVVVRRLLEHPNADVAAAAAFGEWRADPKGLVRESLRDAWRRAVIRADGQGYELLTILPHDSELAFEWLQNYLLRDAAGVWRGRDTAIAAVKSLSLDQRKALLPKVGRAKPIHELAQSLIGHDRELYRQLLAMQDLECYQLVPLEARPDAQWADLALEALGVGYEPREIVDAAFRAAWSWFGRVSDMCQLWIDAFEAIGKQDERLQVISREGRERAREMRNAELERERAEEVYGR